MACPKCPYCDITMRPHPTQDGWCQCPKCGASLPQEWK